jgi:hypothetical protein
MHVRYVFRWIFMFLSLVLVGWVSFSVYTAFRATPDQVKIIDYQPGVKETLNFAHQDYRGKGRIYWASHPVELAGFRKLLRSCIPMSPARQEYRH